MTQKRESWITLAKTVALILVIFIHSTPRDEFTGYLTGFVMPAFFILYGVTHNAERKRDNLGKYILNRMRALMIPYIVLSFLMYAMYFAVYPTVDLGFNPAENIYWFIYGAGPPSRVNHLWFLRTMFFAIIFFSLIDRYLHDKPAASRFFILLITPGLGTMLKYSTGVELVPWGFDAVLIALSFMMIGSEIRRRIYLAPWSINPRVDFVGLITAFSIYSVLSLNNGFVNIGESLYGLSIYSYMITGVLGTYIVVLLSFYAAKRFTSLGNYATAFNNVGQEIYETHPLIIELNVQLFGGLAILQSLAFYPNAPLLILNFPLSILFSYLFATKVVSRSGILQLMFLGFRKKKPVTPEPTIIAPEIGVPIPVHNANSFVGFVGDSISRPNFSDP